MDYADIRRHIDRLRRNRNKIKVFGADGHLFRIKPRATKDRVRRFEERFEVSLPADYRGFLIEVGNGGAGPFYGIHRLGEMDGVKLDEPWLDRHKEYVGWPATRFPYTEPWNDRSGRPDPDQVSEDEYERQLDEFEKRYWTPIDGAFPICHVGCAIRVLLVLTGPEAGQLWQDDRASDNGIYPLAGKSGERLTFGAWYQAWLDDAMAKLE